MPKITFQSTQGEGYQPLPKGSYNVQIDSVDPNSVSRAGNQQMMCPAHVVDGPHAGKKLTLWYVTSLPQSGFRLRDLLAAAAVEHEIVELEGELVDGKPMLEVTFDPDDLPGCIITLDADLDESQGKPQNRFNGERAPKGATAKPAPTAAKPATAAPAAAAAPAVAAGPVRRVRQAGGVQ